MLDDYDVKLSLVRLFITEPDGAPLITFCLFMSSIRGEWCRARLPYKVSEPSINLTSSTRIVLMAGLPVSGERTTSHVW